MELELSGDVFEWRGPAPHHFVRVPDEQSGAIEAASQLLTYGWGCIPVTVRLGSTEFTTSLFPKDGGYLVPLKLAVRTKEKVELGDRVSLTLLLDI